MKVRTMLIIVLVAAALYALGYLLSAVIESGCTGGLCG